MHKARLYLLANQGKDKSNATVSILLYFFAPKAQYPPAHAA